MSIFNRIHCIIVLFHCIKGSQRHWKYYITELKLNYEDKSCWIIDSAKCCYNTQHNDKEDNNAEHYDTKPYSTVSNIWKCNLLCEIQQILLKILKRESFDCSTVAEHLTHKLNTKGLNPAIWDRKRVKDIKRKHFEMF